MPPEAREPEGRRSPVEDPLNSLEATLRKLAGATATGAQPQEDLERGLLSLRALAKQLDRRRRILHVDLTSQHGSQFRLAGAQVEGLRVGELVYVSDVAKELGDAAVLVCRVASAGPGEALVVEQPRPTQGITDYRVMHIVEPRGVRIYLVLVVDGRASVVRLTAVLDRGQPPLEMEAALERVAREWKAKLRALSGEQQARFAAVVDETTDPNLLLEDVQR